MAAEPEPDRRVLIGRVIGAFGVKGAVRIAAYGENPCDLLRYKTLLHADGRLALELRSGRAVNDVLIAEAAGLESKEDADALRGLQLFVPRSVLPPLQEEEYYLADLIGLGVQSPTGETLGVIRAVQNFGAGDLLEVAPAAGESFFLTFTREVVLDVRIAEGIVTAVRPEETE